MEPPKTRARWEAVRMRFDSRERPDGHGWRRWLGPSRLLIRTLRTNEDWDCTQMDVKFTQSTNGGLTSLTSGSYISKSDRPYADSVGPDLKSTGSRAAAALCRQPSTSDVPDGRLPHEQAVS